MFFAGLANVRITQQKCWFKMALTPKMYLAECSHWRKPTCFLATQINSFLKKQYGY